MTEDNVLDKTNRINLLFDFYGPLLTEKQRVFLKYYFHENYSLGEIASAFDISRQAVYEHIKRAEHMLDEYEGKLQLLAKHEARKKLTEKIEAFMDESECKHTNTETLKALLRQLADIEQ